RVAERSVTASLAGAGVGCYIRSFLPQQPVADTARLVLALATLYRLSAVQLQRLEATGFQTIQALSPPAQATTVFTDLTAATGLNQYRLRGEDAAGRVFYSDTVAVQLVRPGELLVFPIPAAAGEDLQVAGAPATILQISLYDALGRLVRTATGSGALNLVPTAGLQPGVYVLRATPAAGGTALTRRVVLLE
ncbi:MAG: T9SS type A sorting domain-containing protein, partial [Hymenobacter sp.]